jgi:hypothetical protein
VRRFDPATARTVRLIPTLLAAAVLAACSDGQPVAPRVSRGVPRGVPTRAIQAFACSGSTAATVSCAPVRDHAGRGSPVILGIAYIKLTSSNVSYDSVTEIFQFDVTVKNLMNEAIGTPDGTTADPDGIQVFFSSGPTATGGTGTITVANADGTGSFTGPGQPYFAYHEILAKNQVSAARTWRLNVPKTVTTFSFVVYVETDAQYLLVINEVLANPGGTISDTNGEWFEVYNAGTLTVNLQNLLIADSSAAGRRPYHLIGSSVPIAPGGYAVLGNTADTTLNGGVPVNYAYGSSLQLANSLDAVKIARVYGTDTLTVDRAAYASAAISAQNGISRELINPSLDNSNIDGGNWADASTTAVYGGGGRGTPGAQNSAFVP